jgi:hypothetical protein
MDLWRQAADRPETSLRRPDERDLLLDGPPMNTLLVLADLEASRLELEYLLVARRLARPWHELFDLAWGDLCSDGDDLCHKLSSYYRYVVTRPVAHTRLLVALAGELYARDHKGQYPTAPQELVGSYLKALPSDAF